VTAPLPAARIGAAALTATARARGTASDGGGVLGDAPDGVPGPFWPIRLAGEVDRGRAPLAARDRRGRCRRCGTAIGDSRRERIAVLYTERGFEVGDELDELKLLELRVRYRDGLVVYINGREVARRNRPGDLPAMGLATRPHGREWESFYITVTPGLLRRGTNWLTAEVRPSGRRLAPEIDLALTGGVATRLIRGPMVQRLGRDRATLVFDTDLPARGVVEYGPTPELGQRALSAGGGLAVHHQVELTGLAPGKPVHYRVVAGGAASEVRAFHTAPDAGEPLRFAVYGDMRGGHRVHASIVSALVREAPDLVLVTGDLVQRGSDEGDWQRFFQVAEPLLSRIPYYPAAGNHDTGRSGDEQRRLGEIFAIPDAPAGRPPWGHWYSFDVAGVHFVMLDSNAYEHSDQLEWLKLDLAVAQRRGARAIFAAVHNGPYSRGIHGGSKVARESYAPVLAAAGVTMLFSGHDHLYQRGERRGLRYIVSGGGGASLYPVRCGVKGRRRCKVADGAAKAESAHHYVMVTVGGKRARICPKRPDGTPLESCLTVGLR
jgi:3',5'-cyclic AMP phosphodiesterase CpdA